MLLVLVGLVRYTNECGTVYYDPPAKVGYYTHTGTICIVLALHSTFSAGTLFAEFQESHYKPNHGLSLDRRVLRETHVIPLQTGLSGAEYHIHIP